MKLKIIDNIRRLRLCRVRRSLRLGLIKLNKLQPVVGLCVDIGPAIYGRFTGYISDIDEDPYEVLLMDGDIAVCFQIKKITEEELQKWAHHLTHFNRRYRSIGVPTAVKMC